MKPKDDQFSCYLGKGLGSFERDSYLSEEGEIVSEVLKGMFFV